MKFDPKSHAHIGRVRILEREDGCFLAIDNDALEAEARGMRAGPDAFEPFISHSRLSVANPLLNFVQAAPLLYQHLTAQYEMMERLKNHLRNVGVNDDNPFIGQIDTMQDAILLCQSAARDGIAAVSKQLDKERK